MSVSGPQPHWSARVEDTKNSLVSTTLDSIGWVLRIKPLSGIGTPGRVRILARVLWARPSAAADYHDQPVYDMRSLAARGWRNFLSQVAPHQEVRIAIGGIETMVRADRTGLVDTIVEVDLPPGMHTARLATTDENEVSAEVFVHEVGERFGVVSDIDDTVMVTWLPRPVLAFWNAFVIHQSSRQVVTGMPMLYQQIVREYPSAPFVYVSTGAWNVFPVLRRFLYKNGYPPGPLLLTDWGPTNTGLFRSGRAHKERTLEELARMFPQVRWLLIGDDGQHDVDIYGEFAAHHPENVAAIAIRELTGSEQVLAHGSPRPIERSRGKDDVVWVSAPDGHRLLRTLREKGILT